MLMIAVTAYELPTRVPVARKFFVTGVKHLSTGVKYMDSKVDFWFIRAGVKYMDSKVDFWFYSYWGGGGARGEGKEVLCVEIFTN